MLGSEAVACRGRGREFGEGGEAGGDWLVDGRRRSAWEEERFVLEAEGGGVGEGRIGWRTERLDE